jgi:hypothetical protein
VRAALSSSFAFGGNNAALVFLARDVAREPVRGSPRSVVISGAAIASPRGTASGAAAILGLESMPAPAARELAGLDPGAVVDRGALRRMDALSAGACGVMALAAKDAGRAPDHDTGLAFGTAFGALDATGKFLHRMFEKGATLVNPLEFPNLVHNAPAGYASIALAAAGPNVATTQEELAGDEAVATMAERIAAGTLGAALAAGGDLASQSLDEAYRLIDFAAGDASPPASVLGAVCLESADACRGRGGTPWARVVATAGGRLEAAVARVLEGTPGRVDLWLASATNERLRKLESLAHPKLAGTEKLEARRLLGNAAGAGTAVIALAAARIRDGRAKTVLCTAVTRDGHAHATLLAAP